MSDLRLGTRITLWSVLLVSLGIFLCGCVGAIYVLRTERGELDEQLEDEARHIFEEWRNHGEARFDWLHNAREVDEWIAASTPPRRVEIVDPQGRLLYRSSSLKSEMLAHLTPGFHSVSDGARRWRVGVFPKGPITLRLAGDLEAVYNLAQQLVTAFLFTLPIILLFVIVGSRFIAAQALKPIHEITAFAEQITARDLGQRIPLPTTRDEIHRLTTVLNSTFDRLEKSFGQATRFSADASHELKTPLTVLRTSIDAMLHSSGLDLETQQNLNGLLEETKRLSAITESLLLLSRADAGKLELDLRPGDLSEMIQLCAEDAAILFEPRQIHLELQLPPTAPALIDRTRFSQILLNLLDNAQKYNSEQGRVLITLVKKGTAWEISVANTGPGIPPDSISRIFTRFFRGEHSAEKAGHGLGLSLCRELARAHHGDLLMVPSEAGWTTFVFRLPAAHSLG